MKETIKKMKEMARLRKLKQFHEYSEQIVEEVLLKDNLNFSSKRELIKTINNIYLFFSDYKSIEIILIKILSKEKESIKFNGDFRAFLINLIGELNYYKGDYEAAMDNYKVALDLRLHFFEDSHPETIESFSNIALLYTDIGRFSEAEEIFNRVLKIYESEISGHIEDYLTTLWNTGLMYQYWGKYSQAIEKYLTALEISQLNGTDEITDSIENNLGVLYMETGNFQAAEMYLLKSADYTRAYYGVQHPKTITTLNNLFSAQMNLGKRDLSEKGFKKILQIKKTDMPLTTLKIKINYAVLLIHQKKTEKAQKLLNEVLLNTQTTPEIQVKALSNIAKIHYIKEDYHNTLEYLEKALTIQKETTGENHIQYTKLLGMKANTEFFLSEKVQVFKILKKAVEIQNEILLEVSTSFSRDYAWNFLQKINGELNQLISLFALMQKEYNKEELEMNELLKEVFGLILRRKAVVFETGIERYRNIIKDRDPHLKKLFNTLIKTKEEIVLRTTKGYFTETPEENREKVKALHSKAEVIENRISSAVPVYSLKSKTKTATVKLLQEKISEEALFVDFFKFQFFDFSATKEQQPSFGYIIFFIRKDKTDFFIIDDAKEIEKLIKESDMNHSDLNRGVITQKKKEKKDVNSERVQNTLWKLLFKDKEVMLRNKTKKIIVSPDGEFNNLPFESLILDNGQYLIEDYSVQYVSSGRNLIYQHEKTDNITEGIFLFADPSFDLDPARNPLGDNAKQKVEHNIFRNELDQFPQLPGTSTEAKKILNLLSEQDIRDVYIYNKESVNDGELKKINSPKILHLATHGFYLENRIDIHPFARCGIALSGINNILRGEEIPTLYEDGVLTATDILSLNLLSTEIVILSACKTGRGHITPGEGIIGLCSALISSGVSSVLVSLWNVPDVFTVNLMILFYKKLLSGMKKSEALKSSKRKMINTLRRQWGEAPSWVWGGFVLYGDDAPLSALSANEKTK